MTMKKAFSIVELLVVIAVISVLATITVVAASGAISQARDKRAEAMRTVLEQAIAAYYAQEGKWPDAIETALNSAGAADEVQLDNDATDKVFRQIVGRAYEGGTVLVDASGLYVCESSNCGNSNRGCWDNHKYPDAPGYCGDKHCRVGTEFTEAVKKGSRRHIALQAMAFGYQGTEYGKFRRFHLVYNVKTDSVKVTKNETDR